MNFDSGSMVTSVLHPTDFSKASNIAFDHALAISTKTGSNLSVLHIEDKSFDKLGWEDFPG